MTHHCGFQFRLFLHQSLSDVYRRTKDNAQENAELETESQNYSTNQAGGAFLAAGAMWNERLRRTRCPKRRRDKLDRNRISVTKLRS
jgi:hypothetical protein